MNYHTSNKSIKNLLCCPSRPVLSALSVNEVLHKEANEKNSKPDCKKENSLYDFDNDLVIKDIEKDICSSYSYSDEPEDYEFEDISIGDPDDICIQREISRKLSHEEITRDDESQRQSLESLEELISCVVEESRNGDLIVFDPKDPVYYDRDKEKHDTYESLFLRVKDYRTARLLRREKYGILRPSFIHGLFCYLEEVRTDLEWAEDAASSRAVNKPHLGWIEYISSIEESRKIKNGGFCQSFPYLTFVIFILSTMALVVSMWLSNWHFEELQKNPMFGPPSEVLLQMGAVNTPNILLEGEWIRLASATILHSGLVHYVFSMVALLTTGPAVERVHGSLKTTIVFMSAAVSANMLSALFTPNQVTMGSLGGVCALLGICLVDVFANWELLLIRDTFDNQKFPFKSAVASVLSELILIAFIGMVPYIDQFAHLGGLFFGFAFGSTFTTTLTDSGFFAQEKATEKATPKKRFLRAWWRCAVMLLALGLLISAAILLYESEAYEPTPCPGCRYISCAPFPFWKPDQEKWWNCDACDNINQLNFKRFPDRVELTCPYGEMATIGFGEDLMPDTNESTGYIRGLCRSHCDL